MKLSDISSDYRYLVLGQSGTGKTTLIGTLAELMPTVIVTSDAQGLQTLKAMNIKPETEVILISDWADVWDYYKQIAKLSESHAAIAMDDFGSLQETSRRRLEREPAYEDRRQSRAQRELAIREQLMLGDKRMKIQDWGQLWISMENFLYETLKLLFKVKLVTVLEDKANNPRDNSEHIYPALQGSLRTSILPRFGFVGETFISYDSDNKPLYALHCQSHPKVESKTRYGKGRTWVNPTAQKLLKHIQGGEDAESEVEKRVGTGI